MKKAIGIIILGLLWCSFSNAGELKELPNDTTVNSLLQNGWKLYSTNAVATSDAKGYTTSAVYYTLTKGREVVTCALSSGKVRCWKP